MQSAGLTSLNHDIMASYPLRLTPISQNLGPPSADVSVQGRIHEPIHSILRCSNTLYIYNVKVGCSQRGLPASTMTSWHHIHSDLP